MAIFETFNTKIKSFIHGSPAVGAQLYNNYTGNLIAGLSAEKVKLAATKNHKKHELFHPITRPSIVSQCDDSFGLLQDMTFFSVCRISRGKVVHSKAYTTLGKEQLYGVA